MEDILCKLLGLRKTLITKKEARFLVGFSDSRVACPTHHVFLIHFLDDMGDCQCGVNGRRGKDSAAGLDSDINSPAAWPIKS